MCADSATSVSKGCFVYNGKRKRARDTDYLQSTDRFGKSSFKLFKDSWEDLEIQIDILKSDLNCQIFNNLVTFLKTCHRDRNVNNGRPTEEISTAVLLTGVNTPDHRVMFSSLQSLLKDSVTPYVVSLMSKDCHQVSSLIQVLVSRLTNTEIEDQEESMNEDVENQDTSSFQLKWTSKGTSSISLRTLVKWYEASVHSVSMTVQDSKAKYEHQNTPNRTSSEHEGNLTKSKPSIVIMFEDVENIRAKVIQDFVSICSSYMNELPIVFVMGVATSMSALHQLLPSSVSSLLCMEKFQAPPASQYLTQLMDKIIMTPNVPFKLGPKVFHFLLDIFLYHNFSIMNFTFGFQYCMMEHFLSNPLSFLCVKYDDIDSVTHNLSRAQLQHIRQSTAFQRFVEETSDTISKEMTIDDPGTRVILAAALRSLHTYHSDMFVMMRFLHSLASCLPKQPLGRQLREIYSICLKQNITETEDFVNAFQLLKMMSRHDLTEVLTKSLSVLRDAREKSSNMNSVHEEVELLIDRLVNLNEEKEEEDMAMDDDTSAGNIRMLPKRAKLHELKEKLLSMPSRRKLSPYESLRNSILDALQDHFKQYLVCPMNKPLHEIFYFNDLIQVKDHFKAVPRCSIQRALTQPSKYLQCACCECDEDEILPSMPDVCIVYKLHLECGTLVNLFDWMQAFITIVSQDDLQKKRKKRQTQKPESHLRARFIRAVSELQFLGFIKSTRRKTDHVERLTW